MHHMHASHLAQPTGHLLTQAYKQKDGPCNPAAVSAAGCLSCMPASHVARHRGWVGVAFEAVCGAPCRTCQAVELLLEVLCFCGQLHFCSSDEIIRLHS